MSILIIDTSYLIYKAYFAYPKLSYQEQPTGAIYGFIKTVFKLVTKWQPTILVFACDLPEETWRHKLFSEYKADRPDIEDNMLKQIPTILDWCQKVTPNYLAVPGFEADDLIWTIVKDFYHKSTTSPANDNWAPETAQTTLIYSADRDLYQLFIFPQAKFIHSRTGQTNDVLFTIEDFRHQYQIQPQQWLDYKALVGDPSDNLPGIPGIGPKTAIRILQQIDHLYHLLDFLQISHQLNPIGEDSNPQILEKVAKFVKEPKNQLLVNKIVTHQKLLEQTYLLAKLQEVPKVKLLPVAFDLNLGKAILEKYNCQSLLTNIANQKLTNLQQSSLF